MNGWTENTNVDWVIAKHRVSKHGDFRPAVRGQRARLSVNGDLSYLQLVLTLTHEIAHLLTWLRHGSRIRPHGIAWKRCFGDLLESLASVESLPLNFRKAIVEHAENPTSASGRDPKLMKALHAAEGGHEIWLDDLPLGAHFEFRGQHFRKIRSNRTRCRCLHLGNRQLYTIGKTAAVNPLSTE